MIGRKPDGNQQKLLYKGLREMMNLKSDYGLNRNLFKGLMGDQLNVTLAAAASNLNN